MRTPLPATASNKTFPRNHVNASLGLGFGITSNIAFGMGAALIFGADVKLTSTLRK